MSDTAKLVIDFPNDKYELFVECYRGNDNCDWLYRLVAEGIPLDDVRAEIVKAYEDATMYSCDEELSRFASRVCGILGNIGKAESEVSE